MLNIPRREGKTFNTAAYALSAICMSQNQSVMLVAAALEQVKRLFRDDYEIIINNSKVLRKFLTVTTSTIHAPKTKSLLDIVATSHSSITGTGRTFVIIDEARDVPERVFMAAIPSILDERGWECPDGHVRTAVTDLDTLVTVKCPTCSKRLQPWYARLIVTSSSSLLDGTGSWFTDLVEELSTTPDKNFHCFRMEQSSNPDLAVGSRDAMSRVFGKIPSLRDLVEVELHNRPTRVGDNYLPKAAIEACIDTAYKHQTVTQRRAVGFLDTSMTTDLTSLVILVDDSAEDERLFTRLRTGFIHVWDPKEQPTKTMRVGPVLAVLDEHMERFPGLVTVGVDMRRCDWGVEFMQVLKSRKECMWARRFFDYRGGVEDRILAWEIFEQRVLSRTILFPRHDIMLQELAGVRRVQRLDGRTEIRDAAKSKRHADVVDSFVHACLLAHKEILEAIRTRVTLTQISDVAENRRRAKAGGRDEDLLGRLSRGKFRAPKVGDIT